MNEETPRRSRCGALLAVSAAALCLAAPAAAQDAGGASATPGSTTPGSTTSGSTTPGSTTPGSTTPATQPSTTSPTSPPPRPGSPYTPDPNPYYIGVGQGFTHDTNVYRIPSGPSDTYSSTTLFGGFNQPISRQRVYGRAGVSLNRYANETQLNNTSYDLSVGADLETIEHISGSVNLAVGQHLATLSTAVGTPSAGRNQETTQRADARVRWGGPSLLSVEAGISYYASDYSSPLFVTSESRETTGSLGVYYRPGEHLRLGIAGRFERTKTPKAIFDPNLGYQPNTTDGRNIDFLVDYVFDPVIRTNARLSYTRQTNSVIATSNFSGFTGSVAVTWQPTVKTTVVFDAARDAGFEANTLNRYAVVQAGTGLTLTPVAVVYENNRVTDSFGVGAGYEATAKISGHAGLRYTRARLAGAVEAGLDARNVDVLKSAALSANYAITRAWNATCTIAYETRTVTALVSYTYDANVIGCSTQFTWH